MKLKKHLFICFLMIVASACATLNNPKRETASVKKAGIYFEDITTASGIPDMAGSSIIVSDYDNDYYPDFMMANRLFRNTSTPTAILFEDVTVKAGLEKNSGDAIFIDINNDDQPDIITITGQVYIQNKGVFTERSKEFGLVMPAKAFALSYADVNRDGFADLIVGVSEIHENNTFTFVPGKFFLNIEGKAFKEDNRFNLDKYPAYTRGIQWADFDNDSYTDAYFSNYRLRQNFLFKNNKGIFTESAPEYRVQGEYSTTTYLDPFYKKTYGPQYGHTIGSVWADFNNDGNLDLWAANLVHKFVGKNGDGSYDIRGYVCDDSKIYRNMGAPDYKFTDVRRESGIPMMPMGDWSKYKGDELWSQITAADFDNDGLVDTYVAQVYNLKYANSFLFKNNGNFKFSDISLSEPTRVFDSYAAAWADFNNDGKMDLLISGRDAVDATPTTRLLKNIFNNPANHFVKIKLVGTTSGKNPVGTQVRIFHDKGVTMRQYEGVSGTLSQENDPNLHFGLGNATTINSIEVRWSSGKRQMVTGVKMDQGWIVTELK